MSFYTRLLQVKTIMIFLCVNKQLNMFGSVDSFSVVMDFFFCIQSLNNVAT